ncbi:hypothetical protein [Synechococcus elongatus]|uniref:Uncharacterized protein n=1 Tax=Synechococcus elongatus (strain ATCC 33912 / PCC 7942 / FACHB-805) TaxID=1140 RepID=Q31PJ0_SYNE7|nr:hypothetical protein [Synechococcus elongatus]ABB57029.1 hypothetical protein Synpcc7942_0999 [Synechococcus elongatus PCC 7942 = FACHB-805]AJD58450.1 hypothetical protein M744_11705 [Synechococcus elongatus UTEX 2973]UOW70803.1 hypothetical protein PCC7943_1046 [Synechococcus elongatus PCC 7943]UOW73524.1 hypothetical protein PCC6311_1046 [Synechococcus elongatus PCC 6311]UOW76244.1 hypothetical protein PCC6301pg_1046 [Synechococcus elongatus PCC 6301]
MGSKHNFICPSCEYESGLVSGQPDSGMMVAVDTMVCQDCQSVVDVVVQIFLDEYAAEIDLNCCPDCRGTRVSPWPSQHPCPKCQEPMVQDSLSPEMLWD